MFVYSTKNTNGVINLDRVCKIRKSRVGTHIDFLDGDDHDITSWQYDTGEERDKSYDRLLQKIKAVRIHPDDIL